MIANQLPSSFGTGTFTLEGLNVANLTDGAIDYNLGASCGSNPDGSSGNPVPYIIFTPANGAWDLTNIVVYSMHHDYGRDGQYYDVSYSTADAPSTFIPLATVAYNPDVQRDGRATGNRVQIAPISGQTALAMNVAAVKFDFSGQGVQNYGWSDYVEIVLQGSTTAAPVFNQPVVSAGSIILTGSGGVPADGTYTVLTTTNLMNPNWTISTTGTLIGGAFSNAIPINALESARFFRLKVP